MHWLLVAVMLISGDRTAGKEQVIDLNPESLAGRVFVGSDSQMPITGEFLLSIQPTLDASKDFVVPATIEAALLEMNHMSPRWFLAAFQFVARKHDPEVCLVSVNDQPVSSYLKWWIWKNWRMRDKDSPIASILRQNGVSQNHGGEALLYGLCSYVRTGELAKGVEAVLSYASSK